METQHVGRYSLLGEAGEKVDMSPTPIVSVIVPIYNAETYLEETINSVLAQTLGSEVIEIVAIDDGSTDSSREILERMRDQHNCIRIDSIPNSGSAAAPRNRGLDLATGTYVFFLDADDLLDESALQVMVDLAERSGSGVVLGKMENFGPGADRSIPRRVFTEPRFAADFVESFAYRTLGPVKLFRRDLIEANGLRFPCGYRIGEDQPFVMSAYLATPHISAVSDRVCYWVRNHDRNVSSGSQGPELNLVKNANLARAVVNGTTPGPRRDTLLERPFTDTAGLGASFGSAFLTLPRDTRARLLRDAAELGSFWSDGLRSTASNSTRVLLDFVFAGDLDSVEWVAGHLREERPLPVSKRGGSTVVISPYGAVSGPLKAPTPTVLLEALTFEEDGMALVASVGRETTVRVADIVVVWVHRKTLREVRVPAKRIPGTSTSATFHSLVSARQLKTHDVWDAFVELRYKNSSYRQRLGKSKRIALQNPPTKVGANGEHVVFFTEYHNLSFDVGTARRYKRPHVGDVVTHEQRVRAGTVVRIHSEDLSGDVFAIYNHQHVRGETKVTGRAELTVLFRGVNRISDVAQITSDGEKHYQFASSVRGVHAPSLVRSAMRRVRRPLGTVLRNLRSKFGSFPRSRH